MDSLVARLEARSASSDCDCAMVATGMARRACEADGRSASRSSATGCLRGVNRAVAAPRLTAAMDPTPACPLEPHRHLGGRQPDHAVMDTWPTNAALLKPFIHQ